MVRDAGEQQVGAQPAHVGAEPGQRPVGGDEQVGDVEPLRTVVAGQFGVGSCGRAHQLAGGRTVPAVPGDARGAVSAGAHGQGEQAVAGAASQGSVGAADVHRPVACHPVSGELRGLQGLAAEGLDRVAPQPGYVHQAPGPLMVARNADYYMGRGWPFSGAARSRAVG